MDHSRNHHATTTHQYNNGRGFNTHGFTSAIYFRFPHNLSRYFWKKKTGGNTVKCQLHQERAATTLPDRGGRRLLCVTSERPECRLATDIKQTDHFVFTSGYQQLTIWPELATVSGVSEPCKCLHRLLGECAINVDLKENILWGMKGHFNAWWNGQWKTKWLWIHN